MFGLYLAASVVAFWHVWAHPATWQPDAGAGDVARYDWFVAWVPWALGHATNPFVTHVANIPFGVNLMDDTSVMALGLIMAPVTLLFGPAASVNVLLTLAFPLSAGAGYLLARRFVDLRPAAFAAGLLYGFSPYMVGQGATHLNLSFVPLPPLILLALHELLIRQKGSAVRWGFLLGVMVALQLLISTEITATTALFSAIAIAVVAVAGREEVATRLRHAAVGLAVGAGVASALLAVPLYEALAGQDRITGTIAGYQDYYSALLAPLLPTANMALGTRHLDQLGGRIGGNLSENGTYLGLPLVILVLVAAVAVRRRAARIGAALAAVAFVLSMGIRFHLGLARDNGVGAWLRLPGDLIFHIPKLNDAFPIRYSLFVALFVSIVVAVTLEEVAAGHRARAGASVAGRRTPAILTDRRLWAAAVAVVVLVPLLPAWPYRSQGPTGVPSYFTTSEVDALAPGTPTLVYPVPVNTDAAPMIWQAEAGMRFEMVGGYFVVPAASGSQFFAPTESEQVLAALAAGSAPARSAALRARLRAQLGGWGIRAVLVRPIGSDPAGFFTWLIGRPPDAIAGGMVAWYRTDWTGAQAEATSR